MAFGRVPVIIFIVFTVFCAFASSKDAGFSSQNENDFDDVMQPSKYLKPPAITVPKVRSAGRISCQYEEATEDAVCQDHCLPKGYSYGICVSKTCSCI